MLTMNSGLEAATDVRVPFSVGACLPPAAVRTAQPRKGAIAFARPRALWAADVFGQRHPAADLGMALGQPNPSKQNYPYTTRIAASGGTKGPHPARDPDPV
jgi:hypothetical protein